MKRIFFADSKNIRLFNTECDVLKDWKRCEVAFFERRSFVHRAKSGSFYRAAKTIILQGCDVERFAATQ